MGHVGNTAPGEKVMQPQSPSPPALWVKPQLCQDQGGLPLGGEGDLGSLPGGAPWWRGSPSTDIWGG